MAIDLMEKKRTPFKVTHLKQKIRILHYLLTTILFYGVINHNYVIKKDVVPLWHITQEIPTNRVDGIFNYMIWCKENPYAGLPYGQAITKLLAILNVDTIDGVDDPTNYKIT